MNNKKDIEVAVYLPDEEAKKFLLFQQYYDTFSILVESGAFDVKNGAVTMHFDALGNIALVQRADTLFNIRFAKKVIHT